MIPQNLFSLPSIMLAESMKNNLHDDFTQKILLVEEILLTTWDV